MALQSRKSTGKPLIGLLSTQTREPFEDALAAFRDGLAQGGYKGKHEEVHQFAGGDYEKLEGCAKNLVDCGVSVIAAFGGAQAALYAKEATKDIPILFVSGFDPKKVKLVGALDKERRPKGNVTGIHVRTTELCTDRLDVLCKLLPKAKTVAMLVNPRGIVAEDETERMGKATKAAGLKLVVLKANDVKMLKSEFARAADQGAQGLLVSADPFFTSQRQQLVNLAAKHKLPTVYPWRQYVEAGGLISYGPNLENAYRRVGVYAAMILNGVKPAELPVLSPSSYLLVVNMKTARKQGVEIPPLLIAEANQVIQ
jgi:putative ABC transport system substrate-binding protein